MAELADTFKNTPLAPEVDPHEHLMLDPRPRGEMNAMVLEGMHATSWKFWGATAILGVIVVVCLFGAWGYLIANGLGVTGVNRPIFWGIFLSNTVYWIGISHAGAFVSALLRILKAEFRRPFTRAAELITAFGMLQVGLSIFMHMGRVWLAYWLIPYPNERQIWPDFHSPLEWDFTAIVTYLVVSYLYLFLPLIPDLAMARDNSTGWRKWLYRILAVGFRGTEGEWVHLRTAIKIFSFAILPIMVSVTSIVSWDFAAAMRPGWNSTIFGPYFVIGALHSGMGAVAMILAVVRSKMKNMKYFIRPEHFDAIGKIMLVLSMAWAYFFFNDYLVQWYGGDKWTKILQDFAETGLLGKVWFTMLVCNMIIPWLTLWNKKIRSSPWALFTIGLIINIGMWIERFIIIPMGLTINRMPFTWRMYEPSIEIPLTIGTFAFFTLLYMLASRLIPLIPVWEVQEGQLAHRLRKIGKKTIVTVVDLEE